MTALEFLRVKSVVKSDRDDRSIFNYNGSVLSLVELLEEYAAFATMEPPAWSEEAMKAIKQGITDVE